MMSDDRTTSPTAIDSRSDPLLPLDPTVGDQPQAGDLAAALARNRAFAAAGGHEGAVVFPNLRLFVITCLDPGSTPLTSSGSS